MTFWKLSCIFIILSVASCQKVTLPPELQEYVDDLHALCLKRGSLTEDDHQSYDIHDKDPKMMCYMKCLMLESKWMKPDGTIDYHFIESSAHPEVKEILVSALGKCRQIENGADLCEKSYNFNFCMFEADPMNWFFV
ncbi:hypothetical protein ABEB36_013110 [Hypothenemus hampei]|uniref:Uncharacterized protein n=1 Tax=Hypothenemus hampei TaxID=57062 RepID=A0ABD1EBA3_HYPHA